MSLWKTVSFVFIIGLLVSCSGEDAHYYDDLPPELVSFNVVDSYRTNSEVEPRAELRLSPFLDNGEFELLWEVQPNVRYRAELLINDRPSLQGAISISTSWCGPGQDCGNFSYQYCDYKSDLRLECAAPEAISFAREVDIAPLFGEIPDTLHLILEVCDDELFYCEIRSRAIVFE